MEHTTTLDIWTARDTTLASSIRPETVIGYSVEALDGSIGKIDDTTLQTGTGTFVIDTGPWIFGKKVMLPIGVFRSVDRDDETVFVNRTKEQIKNAPEFDESLIDDEMYRNKVGSYYGPGGAGWRDWD